MEGFRDTRVLSTGEIIALNQYIENHTRKLGDALAARHARIKEKARGMPFSKTLGIKVVELGQGYAHLELRASRRFANWNGTVHGGAIAALIDTTIGAAIETLLNFDDELIATIHLGLDYLAPARIGKFLCAKATWREAERLTANGDIPFFEVSEGNKKVIWVNATVIQKPERTEIARGDAWFVVFGSRPAKQSTGS